MASSPKEPSAPKEKPADERELIRELAMLLDETNLTEIEIERAGLRLRVARNISIAAAAPVSYQPAPVAAAPAAASVAAATSAADISKHPGAVPSPMVGTAYLSPEPGKPSFVNIGARVSEGQTVLIVEAMKTMNQIPAHRSGTITRILVEDASPVEYGQPLVVIE